MRDAPVGASKPNLSHTRTRHHSRLRLAAAAFAVLLAATACGSDSTGPKDPPGNNGQLPTPMLGNVEALIAVVSDASDRIIPGLPEGQMRDDLAASFRLLSGALQTGLVVQVRITLAGANAAIERYAGLLQGDAGVDAELDALRLATAAIAQELIAQTGS